MSQPDSHHNLPRCGTPTYVSCTPAVLLRGVVKAVGDEQARARPVSQDVLAGRQVAQRRDAGLDHEAATPNEGPGDVAEAGGPRLLGCEVVERVENPVC